ncbi:HECT-domain-containing protein [Flagelloscypha sp. PMI_526]|nr:HECT-domain-containing protein [Flagelloscypha sp. PMI_526]
MLPVFGDSPAGRRGRRPMNLGGASSTATHANILDSAKARREERALQKRRSDAATSIQAGWRGRTDRLRLKRELDLQLVAATSSSNPDLLSLLRGTVLVGDENVLSQYAVLLAKAQLETLLERPSFRILLPKYALECIRMISINPRSPHGHTLLSIALAISTASPQTVKYLVSQDMYSLLASIIKGTPVSLAKTATVLPTVVSLSVRPMNDVSLIETSLLSVFTHILPIPLLPNRLPLTSLTVLSGKLPFQSMDAVELPLLEQLNSKRLGLEERAHLLSNLTTFVSPRFAKLPDASKRAFLHICTAILQSLPVGSLEMPPSPSATKEAPVATADSDSDSDVIPRGISVRVVSTFEQPAKPPKLDAKTYKRLTTLFTSPSLMPLLHSSTTDFSRRALYSYLNSLLSICGSNVRKETTITAILVTAGPGLIRELWRSYIRPSSLGKEGTSITQVDVKSVLPLTILLCDLYAQSLLTMGDDEFFGKSEMPGASEGRSLTSTSKLPSGPSTSSQPPRNPLTTDDIRTLSKQLVQVAWELYLREDLGQTPVSLPHASLSNSAMDLDRSSNMIFLELESNLRMTWEQVRERVTKLLTGVWARDSRKPFLPPNHWLVKLSTADVNAFIDAALAEDESLATANNPEGDHRGLQRYNPRQRTEDVRPKFTKRQLASMSPRLGVLNNVPFVLPFEVRVQVFRHFIAADKLRLGNSRYTYEGRSKMTRATVRRGRVSQDGFDRLGDADLKAPIEITFIDQFGQEEAGIDGGGVFKEFFTELCKEVFDTDRGLWLNNTNNELYPNPIGFATEAHSLNWYRFIGRILGKAMYEGILVDVAFAGFFLAKWLGRTSFLDDLASLDPELYNGLVFLKHYDGDMEDLSLNFTVTVEELGVTKTVDLIRNGSNTPVTKENRLQYIHLVSHYKLTKQIKRQTDAFFDGLSEIIDPKWLRMFNQQEVQVLLGGVNAPVDIDDLRNNTVYGGLYDDQHETIVAFWNVVESFDQEKRSQLLRFVTSCSRPPLLGFKELQPNFAIRDAGESEDRLPTASTCVNLLKLPRYTSERHLRQKLSQAIAANAGFDLS